MNMVEKNNRFAHPKLSIDNHKLYAC